MTAGNQLKAVITGDISDLKAKLSQADKLLDQYSQNISRVQKAIGQNTQKSRQYEAQLQKLNQELKQGSISQEQFAKESGQLQNSLLKTNRETRAFQRELDRLQKETTQLENGMENLTGSTQDYANAAQRTQRATQKTGQAVNNFGNTTKGNAVPAMQSFSQIIQDAPYGINGVANNIQQLTAQFGYLSNRAGGARGAIKAMIGSLTGPAGILLAVSAVTTVLISYGDEILAAISGTDKLSKATRDYIASANLEATKLQALVGIANDENNSKETRLKALDKINEEYGDYLGNLDLEALKTDKVRTAIDKLTESFFLQAKAKGLSTVLEEKYGKLAEETAKATEIARTSAGYAISRENSEIRKSIRGYEQLIDTLKNQSNVDPKAITLAQQKIAELRESLSNAPKRTDLKIDEYVADETSDTLREIEQFKSQYEKLLKEIFETTPNLGGDKEVRVKVEPVSTLTPSTGIIQPEADIAPISTEIKIEDNTDWEKLYENMERAQEIGNLFANAMGASFSAVASEMAGALSTGNKVIDAFVSTLLQGLAQMAAAWLKQQVMNQIITQTKIQAERAKSSANAITIATNQAAVLGPFGFAALPGLIGSTLAMVNGAFAAAQGFAGGGIIPGGSFNGDKIPAFVNSGEMILNMGQQRELFNLLDGRMGSLQGNAQSLKIQVEGVTRGENIYWSQQRYMNNRSRRG